jgi:hypothetical protein
LPAADVHEFVLLIMMVHLLRPDQAATMPPELLTTLRVVEDAFCCFDTSADGYLEAAEVSAALQVMLGNSLLLWLLLTRN